MERSPAAPSLHLRRPGLPAPEEQAQVAAKTGRHPGLLGQASGLVRNPL